MNSIAVLHACAVSFWFGVIGAEFVIERSRAQSRPHGYAVASNHYWIDLLLEVPVALTELLERPAKAEACAPEYAALREVLLG